MNAYELLSEIYRILGQIDSSVIESARKHNVPPTIDRILHALDEAVSKNGTPRMIERRVPQAGMDDHRSHSGPARSEYVERQAPATFRQKDIAPLLNKLAATHHLTNKTLVRLLNRSGLSIRPRPKEPRRRTLERAVEQLKAMPEDQQIAVLRSLHVLTGVDETSGWMEIIRSFSRE